MRCCSSVRSAPTRQTGAQLQDGRPHVHPIDGIMAGGGRVVAGGARQLVITPLLRLLTHSPCIAMRLPVAAAVQSAQLARSSSWTTVLVCASHSSGTGQTWPSSRGRSRRTWARSSDDFLISRPETLPRRHMARRSALLCALVTVAHARRAGPCGRSADRLRSVGCPTHANG